MAGWLVGWLVGWLGGWNGPYSPQGRLFSIKPAANLDTECIESRGAGGSKSLGAGYPDPPARIHDLSEECACEIVENDVKVAAKGLKRGRSCCTG